MISLARSIAASHKWQAPGEGAEVVRMVFEKLSHDAPKTDAQMIEWYRQTGVRLVTYARKTGLFDVPADYRLDGRPDTAAARRIDRGCGLLLGAAFQEDGRRALLRDADRQ